MAPAGTTGESRDERPSVETRPAALAHRFQGYERERTRLDKIVGLWARAGDHSLGRNFCGHHVRTDKLNIRADAAPMAQQTVPDRMLFAKIDSLPVARGQSRANLFKERRRLARYRQNNRLWRVGRHWNIDVWRVGKVSNRAGTRLAESVDFRL